MMINCNESLIPLSAVYGTYLNSRITCYDRLARRIAYQLGAPLVTLEASTNMINEFITTSCELYSQFAGYTREYLVFNSCLYEPGKGVRLDTLFSLTPSVNALYDNTQTTSDTLDESQLTTLSSLSAAAYDYSLDSYRKVMEVFNFEEGQSSGINTLFTLEQSLAQQSYYQYSVGGGMGFDLTSWYCMKEWIKLREKVLATLIDWKFNQATQYIQLIPEPTQNQPYWGIVGCYVEKPVVELIKESWVQKYTLALTKIAISNVRGKYANSQLFGGGTINYSDLMTQGLKEKDELEAVLFTGSTPGWTADPCMFMIG